MATKAELERELEAFREKENQRRRNSAKGGATTWANMTPEERSERSRKMLEARQRKYASGAKRAPRKKFV